MASVAHRPDGTRRVQFTGPDGRRRTLYLGKVPKRAAEEIRGLVERLNAALLTGSAPADADARRVAGLDDVMHGKLSAAGLTAPRAASTLGPFLDGYLTARAAEVKPPTLRHLSEAAAALTGFLGRGAKLRDVTPADADRFRSHLLGRGLPATSTVPRRLGRARQFFTAAVRAELCDRNPFDGLSAGVRGNPARSHFLTPADAARVLTACPPGRWTLAFSLLRWGGLRCPSELKPLVWDDVHWPDPSATDPRDRAGWVKITSPKTEHHARGASRVLPLFPELLDPLRAAFDAAPAGSLAVLPDLPTAPVLRRQFLVILDRAGLEPWPKLFHNLRASRQTELAASFPLHVVCEWIGNTAAVAAENYLTVTAADFERAAVGNAESNAQATQNPTRHASAGRGTSVHAAPGNASGLASVPRSAGAYRSLKCPGEDSNLHGVAPTGT